MSFNSLYFILMFLPVTLPAYYAAARRSAAAADWILVGAAVVFYGFTNAWYPVMLGVLLSVNWGITLQIRRAQTGTATGAAAGTAGKGVSSRTEEEKTAENRASQSGAAGEKTAGEKTAGEKTAPSGGNAAQGKTAEKKTAQTGGGGAGRAWMIAGIAGNVAVLAVFKYTNFFIGNLNALFGSDRALVDLILPLGISFIIFGQIAWIVDSFRGSTADVSLREYVVYASFFPKLSQGPITLPRDFLPQIRKEGRQCFDYERMMVGIQMFVCGLAKKLFLADTLGTAVDWYYDTMQFRSNVDTVIVLLTYTLQIYCDFSGYSDMALGVSKMLGFDLPANFDSPYRACSVTEFWKRWHISLTTFLREYIYFPLGGSRKGSARTYRNIMVVYLVSGFWHGASWTYVLWGVVHGLAQCAERLLGRFWHGVLEPAAAKIRSVGRDAGAEKIRSAGWDAGAGDSESGAREGVPERFRFGEQKAGAGDSESGTREDVSGRLRAGEQKTGGEDSVIWSGRACGGPSRSSSSIWRG